MDIAQPLALFTLSVALSLLAAGLVFILDPFGFADICESGLALPINKQILALLTPLFIIAWACIFVLLGWQNLQRYLPLILIAMTIGWLDLITYQVPSAISFIPMTLIAWLSPLFDNPLALFSNTDFWLNRLLILSLVTSAAFSLTILLIRSGLIVGGGDIKILVLGAASCYTFADFGNYVSAVLAIYIALIVVGLAIEHILRIKPYLPIGGFILLASFGPILLNYV